MKDLLKKENCFIRESVTDWKEAVEVSLESLVEQGYCEKRYIDGVVNNTEKYGPYYVLAENLALVHANKDQGAIKPQFTVTLLKEPVKFKENGLDVRVLVGMVAVDDSHLEAMQRITDVFMNQDELEKLLNAEDADAVYNIFVK